MISLLKCPICGGTERSLLPSSVCEECGCDMKPDTSEARRVLFDKSQPKEARMAAMNVLQPKLAAAPAPANPHIGSSFDDFLREEGIAPAEAREPVVPNAEDGDFDCPKAAAARACPCDRSEQSGPEVLAWLVTICERPHIYHGSRDPREVHDNGGQHEPLITLSSHQQAVEALRAEVERLRKKYLLAELDEATVAAVMSKRAESAEARLARVAAVLADLRGRLTPSADFLADQIAAAIAPQEG